MPGSNASTSTETSLKGTLNHSIWPTSFPPPNSAPSNESESGPRTDLEASDILGTVSRELEATRLDLQRARMLLTTARQLVREERAEINRLRRRVERVNQRRLHGMDLLIAENEQLREQLASVSRVHLRA